MPKLKLPPDDISKIIETLNAAKTVAKAAVMLSVTRQALRNYMNTNGIECVCEYRQTRRSIDIKADRSAKGDPQTIDITATPSATARSDDNVQRKTRR